MYFDDWIPYEFRCVDRFEKPGLYISTAYVDDTRQYETAIASPYYNAMNLVIVEQYANKEQAETGHEKWVRIMDVAYGKLPNVLDTNAADVFNLLGIVLGLGQYKKAPLLVWHN
jgi:hypothetical protein